MKILDPGTPGTIAALGLAAALLAPALSAQRPKSVSEGDKPAYKFQDALVNGMGVTSLADLQGKPTVVEFWGTH
jgi:hypothetical protein